VPSIAAANSGKVTGVPMTTPPETPSNTGSGNHSAAGTKRPGEASESEKEEASDREVKKRRIAPTLVERP
jgi:chromatin assembly factor 1 subunit B